MTKPENVLKVILAPNNMIVDTYKSLILEGNEADFITIMDLRVKIAFSHFFLNFPGIASK
jgi:hypothetical protein